MIKFRTWLVCFCLGCVTIVFKLTKISRKYFGTTLMGGHSEKVVAFVSDSCFWIYNFFIWLWGGGHLTIKTDRFNGISFYLKAQNYF